MLYLLSLLMFLLFSCGIFHPRRNFASMILKIFCISLALASTSRAFPNHEIHSSRDILFKSSIREKLAGPPTGWVKDEDVNVDKSSVMNLRIHLVHQDMDKFHELATNVRPTLHHLPRVKVNASLDRDART